MAISEVSNEDSPIDPSAILAEAESVGFGNPAVSVPLAQRAAAEWRKRGLFFRAGCVLVQAAQFAQEAWQEAQLIRMSAIDDFRQAAAQETASPIARLSALNFLAQELGYAQVAADDPKPFRLERRDVTRQMADRIVEYFGQSEDAPYHLINGVGVRTDYEQQWFIGYSEQAPIGTMLRAPNFFQFHLPSACQLYASLGDFAAAVRILDAHPDFLKTPVQRAWREVYRAFAARSVMQADYFASAAEVFSTDTHPGDEAILAGRSWSSINVDLWAKYFRALSLLAQISTSPDKARDLLQDARKTLEGTDVGWVNERVSLLRALLIALSEVIEDPAGSVPNTAVETVSSTLIGSGLSDDHEVYLECIDRIIYGFALLREHPGRAALEAPLRDAVELLGLISVVGAGASGLTPLLSDAAALAMRGPYRTAVHRVLESLARESDLRHLLMRLLQAEHPRYAQLRHGPFEYGKDLATVIEAGGQRILRCYQVKAGDIDKAVWRDLHLQVEEIFLKAVDPIQLGGPVDVVEAVVVCNGHITPFYDEVIGPWCRTQTTTFGRSISFMHIDALVRWIVDNQLLTEFRSACMELGLTWPSAA